MICPCGRDRSLDECCGAIHSGRQPAPTAEDLMRSRYAAFALGDAEYLLRSWAPGSRPAALTLDPRQRWTGLTIVDTVDGGALAATGIVEFVATFDDSTGGGSVAERSRFARHAGRWVYVDVAP